jgi:hypothetical protein
LTWWRYKGLATMQTNEYAPWSPKKERPTFVSLSRWFSDPVNIPDSEWSPDAC